MADINKIISGNVYHEGAACFFKGVNSVNTVRGFNKDWASIVVDQGIVQNGVAVTPDDSTVLPCTKGLWVGTGGNISVIHDGDTTAVTYQNVPGGVLLPFHVTKVMSTDTTASNIVAIYN